jgi:hypothetical protein
MGKQETAATGGKRYLTNLGLARRYSVTPRTIDRWRMNPKLQFPPPDMVVNDREYRQEETMEVWERRRATASNT